MNRFLAAPRTLKLVIGLIVAVFAVGSVRFAWLATIHSGNVVYLTYAVVLAFLMFGLLRLSASARVFTTWLLWFVVIALPIGAINPFAAIDYAPDFPSVLTLLLRVLPVVAVCLIALHFLTKYKRHFE